MMAEKLATDRSAVKPGEMWEGRIRVAEIHTPSEEWEDPNSGERKPFEKYRRGVRFSNGRASLPEPVKVDFDDKADWKREHDNWLSLIDYMKREYHYEVKYRWVSSESED